MAAVLACGDGAVLSHRSAAAPWGLRPDNRATSDVTSHGRAQRECEGIAAHSGRGLTPVDRTVIDGIACTSLARTLLDLAEVTDRHALERAFDRADTLRLLNMGPLEELLKRSDGRRGVKLIRAVLAEHYASSTLTESALEELFLAICPTAGVAAPEVNAWVVLDDGTSVRTDFLWREQRLIVETDGRDVHSTRQAFERDRERDQRLTVAGWRVVRFTWRQLTHEPERVAQTLRAMLAQGPARRRGSRRTRSG